MGNERSSFSSRAELLRRLYEADTTSEGLSLFFSLFPRWVPPVALIGGCCAYYLYIIGRVNLTRWRILERRRAQRKYELLEDLRGIHKFRGGMEGNSGVRGGGLAYIFSEEDDEEDEGEEDDKTAVSVRDMDEFRSSLGILIPRDEDLLALLERLLVEDPIPEGWVLYRTTAGIIRFMNQNTQELSFFHPMAEGLKYHIESTLRQRNRKAMESKYATRAVVESGGESSGSLELNGFSESHLGGGTFQSSHLFPWTQGFSSSGNRSGSPSLGDGSGEDLRGSGVVFGDHLNGHGLGGSGGSTAGSGNSIGGLGASGEGGSQTKKSGSTKKGSDPLGTPSVNGSLQGSSGLGMLSSSPPPEGLSSCTQPQGYHRSLSDGGSGSGGTTTGAGGKGGNSGGVFFGTKPEGLPQGGTFSLVQRAVKFFLEREQKKIEKDVMIESQKAAEARKSGEIFSSTSDGNDRKEHKEHHEAGGRVFLPGSDVDYQTMKMEN